MEKITEVLKKHPLAIVGGVGALVLIYLYASSSTGSASTSSAYPPPPSDAQIAAASQVQLGALALQGQGISASAAVAATHDTNAAGVTIAGYQADVARFTVANQATAAIAATDATRQVQLAGIDASASVQKAGLSTQEVVAGYQRDLGLAQIGAATGAAVIQAASNAQAGAFNLRAQQSANATLIDITAINAAGHNYNPNSSQMDLAASENNLISTIAGTGATGSGLLPKVSAAVAGGGTWASISSLVQSWAQRTTNSKNAAGKQSILDALNNPIYAPASPSSGFFATNLLLV